MTTQDFTKGAKRLKRNSSDPFYDWEYKGGDRPAPIQPVTFSGSGFGNEPPVIVYADWSGYPAGSVVQSGDAIFGSFPFGNYLSGLRSLIIDAHGKRGASIREGGTNEVTDNRRTGLTLNFTGKKNFHVSYDFAVPAGRTFPGTSTPNTLPSGVSSAKLCWLSQSALDIQGAHDVVVGTWNGSSFNVAGNDCPISNYFLSNSIDFNGFNEVQLTQIAGANPFVDNATLRSIFSNNVLGALINQKTDQPAYQYKERYTAGLQSEGYTHRITINGVNCDYVQLAADTTTSIATGLRMAVSAQAIPNVSVESNGNAVIITAALRTTFSGSGSASLTRLAASGNYDHFSCPAWSGNGTNDISQIVFSRLYLAASDDNSCVKRVDLINNSNYDASTIRRPLYKNKPEDVWGDSWVSLTPPSYAYLEGVTHKCLTLENGSQIIEALNG